MDVNFAPLSLSEFDEAFDLATEVFSAASTLHRALGVTLPAYRSYLAPSFVDMLAEGWSFGAFDASGVMIGCMIAGKYSGWSDRDLPAPFDALHALTGALLRSYAPRGNTLLVDMGCVVASATGAGIYTALRHCVHEHARVNGMEFVLGELSSMETQHVVLNNFKHIKRAEINFDTFEFQGKRPFASITKPPSLILAEGRL